MSIAILQSTLDPKAYPIITDPEELELYLGGNWRELDPVVAGRTAYFIKTECGGKEAFLSETKRSSEQQEMYYAEYQYYLRTGKLGPHRIKLAAKPGSSAHEYYLAYDVRRGHKLYDAPNSLLKKYGLCKPLWNKGEYWHVQPIELNTTSSAQFKKWAPIDLAPQLTAKFGFGDGTLIYIRDYEYGAKFAADLIAGRKDFADVTVDYFEVYKFWDNFEAKTGIY